jgi:hypothetical protein
MLLVRNSQEMVAFRLPGASQTRTSVRPDEQSVAGKR